MPITYVFKLTATGSWLSPWLGRDPIYASAQMINNLQSLISRRTDLTQGMGVISIGNIQGGTVEM